ncbi:hypothetical protein F4678DRAFT_100367 [Xylaria arbuscula]|nr:hypothetical protein F4678DRAFT_100367 [Xylaria arbuscula]
MLAAPGPCCRGRGTSLLFPCPLLVYRCWMGLTVSARALHVRTSCTSCIIPSWPTQFRNGRGAAAGRELGSDAASRDDAECRRRLVNRIKLLLSARICDLCC